MRKNILVTATVISLASLLLFGAAMAQQASSKAAIKVSNIVLLSEAAATASQGSWINLLSANLHTASNKDLLILLSLECGLFAKTKARSSSSATLEKKLATSSVKVRVLIDGATPAEPGEVVFCRKAQQLTTQLLSTINTCEDGSNGTPPDGIITLDECTLTEQELELLMESLNANTFNFAVTDLAAGTHTVQVQAWIDLTAADDGVEAKALIGKGSLAVEEIRLVKDADITL